MVGAAGKLLYFPLLLLSNNFLLQTEKTYPGYQADIPRRSLQQFAGRVREDLRKVLHGHRYLRSERDV